MSHWFNNSDADLSARLLQNDIGTDLPIVVYGTHSYAPSKFIPLGNAFKRELQSGQSGASILDNLPQQHHVASVRVTQDFDAMIMAQTGGTNVDSWLVNCTEVTFRKGGLAGSTAYAIFPDSNIVLKATAEVHALDAGKASKQDGRNLCVRRIIRAAHELRRFNVTNITDALDLHHAGNLRGFGHVEMLDVEYLNDDERRILHMPRNDDNDDENQTLAEVISMMEDDDVAE